MDRTTFEAIEAYVLDRMTAGERVVFERRMADDPALRAEVELERENIRAVELGGMARMLKEIAQEQGAGSVGLSRGGWNAYLKIAAMIAVLATAAIWWIGRVPIHERLFAEHFVVDPGLPVEMGVAGDITFADAMVSYKEGHYAEARWKWMPLLQQDPRNDTLRFYIGSAALAEGDADAAIPHLLLLADDTGTVFHDRSRWYLFLAYVRTGQVVEARALGLEGDRVYGDRVRRILSVLE